MDEIASKRKHDANEQEETKKGKKKKSYYTNRSTRLNTIGSGNVKLDSASRGILITCNHNEKWALNEAYSILNMYADRLSANDDNECDNLTASPSTTTAVSNAASTTTTSTSTPTTSTAEEDPDSRELSDDKPTKRLREEKDDRDDSGRGSSQDSPDKDKRPDTSEAKESLDFEEQLEAEIYKEKAKQRRFQSLKTDCKNILFISVVDNVDPFQITNAIFEDICQSKRRPVIKYMHRLLPIAITSKHHPKSICKAFQELLSSAPEEATTFKIFVKIRNNASLHKADIIQEMGKVAAEVRPNWKVCFDEPKFVINVEVLRTICCMSILEDFDRFKKYNPIELINSLNPTPLNGKQKGNDAFGTTEEEGAATSTGTCTAHFRSDADFSSFGTSTGSDNSESATKDSSDKARVASVDESS